MHIGLNAKNQNNQRWLRSRPTTPMGGSPGPGNPNVPAGRYGASSRTSEKSSRRTGPTTVAYGRGQAAAQHLHRARPSRTAAAGETSRRVRPTSAAYGRGRADKVCQERLLVTAECTFSSARTTSNLFETRGFSSSGFLSCRVQLNY